MSIPNTYLIYGESSTSLLENTDQFLLVKQYYDQEIIQRLTLLEKFRTE